MASEGCKADRGEDGTRSRTTGAAAGAGKRGRGDAGEAAGAETAPDRQRHGDAAFDRRADASWRRGCGAI